MPRDYSRIQKYNKEILELSFIPSQCLSHSPVLPHCKKTEPFNMDYSSSIMICSMKFTEKPDGETIIVAFDVPVSVILSP